MSEKITCRYPGWNRYGRTEIYLSVREPSMVRSNDYRSQPRSAGKTYEDAVGDRWKMTTPMPEAVKKLIVMNVNEVEKVAAQVDFVFSAVDMSKDEIKAIEEAYARTETPVVSNNSAHRWTPDVPMVVPLRSILSISRSLKHRRRDWEPPEDLSL